MDAKLTWIGFVTRPSDSSWPVRMMIAVFYHFSYLKFLVKKRLTSLTYILQTATSCHQQEHFGFVFSSSRISSSVRHPTACSHVPYRMIWDCLSLCNVNFTYISFCILHLRNLPSFQIIEVQYSVILGFALCTTVYPMFTVVRHGSTQRGSNSRVRERLARQSLT